MITRLQARLDVREKPQKDINAAMRLKSKTSLFESERKITQGEVSRLTKDVVYYIYLDLSNNKCTLVLPVLSYRLQSKMISRS